MKQMVKVIIYTGLYYPIIFIILFYSFVFRAMNKLGYVPQYNHPDPKDLQFESHRNLVNITGQYLAVSLVIILVAVLIFFFRRTFLRIKPVHYIISVILVLVVVLTFLSPLMEWFGD